MFLRRMLDGTLELGRSVVIVDEVDDLIVNEKPNAHYVKVRVRVRVRVRVKIRVCSPNPNPNPSEKPNAHYVKVAAIEVRSIVCTANPNPNPSPLALAVALPDRCRAHAGAGLLPRGAARRPGQAGGRGGGHAAL